MKQILKIEISRAFRNKRDALFSDRWVCFICAAYHPIPDSGTSDTFAKSI